MNHPLPREDSTSSAAATEAIDAASMAAALGIRIVRDAGPPHALCPACGARLSLALDGTGWTVRRPDDVAERLVLQLGGLPREELHVLLLDTKCVVIGQERVYQGNVSASVVRIAELFRDAVHRNASAVILVHNHPSGDPTPSPDDLHVTAEASAAGRLLQIPVLDHLIVARDEFTSLRSAGVTFDDLRATRR